jgi:hypothetical protein
MAIEFTIKLFNDIEVLQNSLKYFLIFLLNEENIMEPNSLDIEI